MSRKAQEGDKVTIHYSGKLEDETIFDSTEGRDPFHFSAGSADVIKGVSHAVIGMETGDKKTVRIPPEEAYGEYNESLVVDVPQDVVPSGAQKGSVLSNPTTGQTWVVMDVSENGAKLDGNHILAGKTLIFDIELVSVE